MNRQILDGRRFPAWRGGAAAAAALLLIAPTPAPEPPAPDRLALVAALAGLLRLGTAAAPPAPYADVAPNSAAGRLVARAARAGLLAHLPGVGRDFGPRAPATYLFAAALAGAALGEDLPPPPPALVARLGRAGAGAAAARLAARAAAADLLPPPPAGGWSAPLSPAAFHALFARLSRRLDADRPFALALRARAGAVAVDVLDPLAVAVRGAGGRAAGVVAGERLAFRVLSPKGGRGAVAGGDFLASRPGVYRVRAVLSGGLAGRGVASPWIALTVYGRAVRLSLALSGPVLVADGEDAVLATVSLRDARGDVSPSACAGTAFTLSAPPPLRLRSPHTGLADLGALTLPCAAGQASFTLVAPVGAAPGQALLTARAAGAAVRADGGPIAPARAVLAVAAPVPTRLALRISPSRVAAGGEVAVTAAVLDQAGDPMPQGAYALRLTSSPAVLSPAAETLTYRGGEGLGASATLAVAAAAPPGPVTLTLAAPGLDQARAVVRVAAAGAAVRLVAKALASAVPLAAAQASLPSDPVDTVTVTAVDAAGAPVPVAGGLAVRASWDGRALGPGGLGWAVAPAPGPEAGFTLSLFGGPGREVRPGLYAFTLSLPDEPQVPPVTVEVRVVSPPAPAAPAGASKGRGRAW
ncbi:MAG: hypothetical protein K6V73_05845 [Firmicutes bacterium]|nr:hypothetical protein [Bacillota bacterium]